MLKKFLMKKMLQSQLKSAPKQQQEQVMMMFEKNPQLFETIAKEVKQEMKAGKNQMAATMVVMKKHQKELQQLQ